MSIKYNFHNKTIRFYASKKFADRANKSITNLTKENYKTVTFIPYENQAWAVISDKNEILDVDGFVNKYLTKDELKELITLFKCVD